MTGRLRNYEVYGYMFGCVCESMSVRAWLFMCLYGCLWRCVLEMVCVCVSGGYYCVGWVCVFEYVSVFVYVCPCVCEGVCVCVSVYACVCDFKYGLCVQIFSRFSIVYGWGVCACCLLFLSVWYYSLKCFLNILRFHRERQSKSHIFNWVGWGERKKSKAIMV